MTGGSYRGACRTCERSISMASRYCPFCGEVQTHVRDDVELATVERAVLEELVETAKGKLEGDVSRFGPDATGYDVDEFAATIEAAEDALGGDAEIVTDGGVTSGGGTEHTTVGEIDGHHVEFTVKGPEQQDLEDSDDRVGSDILAGRINRTLHELKTELEDCNVDTEGER